jgi:hypothetical protein
LTAPAHDEKPVQSNITGKCSFCTGWPTQLGQRADLIMNRIALMNIA